MLPPALRLEMALYSTSIAYDRPLPIVALAIIAFPIVALLSLQIMSQTILCYKQCGMWSKTTGHTETGFKGQDVGDDTFHCVHLVRDPQSGCKGSRFCDIWEVGQDVESLLGLHDLDVAYAKVICYFVLV